MLCLDDDMGLRVFNTADGKTLCEVKLKDYVESGQFACEITYPANYPLSQPFLEHFCSQSN